MGVRTRLGTKIQGESQLIRPRYAVSPPMKKMRSGTVM
jgi:hypothetical protein